MAFSSLIHALPSTRLKERSMTDTPRTDEALDDYESWELPGFCRSLERELAETRQQLLAAQVEVKRLYDQVHFCEQAMTCCQGPFTKINTDITALSLHDAAER